MFCCCEGELNISLKNTICTLFTAYLIVSTKSKYVYLKVYFKIIIIAFSDLHFYVKR